MRTRLLLPALFGAFIAFVLALAPLHAQQGAPEEPRQSVSQQLDTLRAELDALGQSLRRDNLSDADLIQRRGETEPITAGIQEAIERLTPRYDALKARLDQLGPKGEKEETGVGTEREEQQKLFNDVDGQLKRARLMALDVDQLRSYIVSRRRGLFTRALFERSFSLLSPDLWMAVGGEFPRDVRAAGLIATDFFSAAGSRLERWRAGIFALIVVAIVGFYFAASHFARRILRREPSVLEPTRLQKIVGALWVAFVSAVVPILVVVALAQTLRGFDLVNARLEPLLQALVEAVRRIALAVGISRGLLAPSRSNWRVLDLSDSTATRVAGLAIGVAGIVSLMKVVEAMNELIAVSLPVAVAVRGVCAMAVALLMAFSLKGIVGSTIEDDECLGPRVEPSRDWYGPLRFAAWIAIVLIGGSVLVGYVAFGAFLTEQIVWTTFVGCLAYLLTALANEGFGVVLRPPARIARAVMSSLGLRRESLEQLAVLLAGVSTVIIVITAILLVLAPWGIESDDMLANVRSAFFGFKIGDVTISLSSIALALGCFTLALFVTRAVQNWLERRFLPHTQLDTGLRNSIRTSVGYVGFVVAAALAMGYLGFSFEKLAIVAGALSVGIGFGLQSIVNNFVSGLILLWERAIRVGDWVVVGSEQGHVRRINVRSTEIETFDRATMIVPNSNLVTGVVMNWVRGDKVGRIKIPLTTNTAADPQHVRDVLIDVAKGHELVDRIPAPNVLFTAMTESAHKFELVCFVSDVEKSGRVKSDLHFAIHARFKIEEIGIAPPAGPPAPPAVVQIGGLEKLGELIEAAKK